MDRVVRLARQRGTGGEPGVLAWTGLTRTQGHTDALAGSGSTARPGLTATCRRCALTGCINPPHETRLEVPGLTQSPGTSARHRGLALRGSPDRLAARSAAVGLCRSSHQRQAAVTTTAP